MTVSTKCPTCNRATTIYFDHVRGKVQVACPKCSPLTSNPPSRWWSA